MDKIESNRIAKLQRLGHMEQLVEGGELIEEITQTKVPRQLPLMLLIIIGIAITMAVWISIIYLTIGETVVSTTLGTHFMK